MTSFLIMDDYEYRQKGTTLEPLGVLHLPQEKNRGIMKKDLDTGQKRGQNMTTKRGVRSMWFADVPLCRNLDLDTC